MARSLLSIAAVGVLAAATAACGEDDAAPGNGYTCQESRNRAPSGLSQCTTRMPGALYLGLLFPTSGPVQVIGSSFEQTVLLALEQVNQAGGIDGQCVGYVLCDAATVPGAPVPPELHDRLRELAGIDQLGAVIGPAFSSEAVALAPTIAELQRPVISGSAGRAAIDDDGGFFFRTQADTALLGTRMADLIHQERTIGQVTRIFVLYLKNEFFAESGAMTVAQRLQQIDTAGELAVELHAYDPANDSSYATRAVQAAIAYPTDIVVSFSLFNDALAVVQAAIALGLTPRSWWTKLIPEWMERIASDGYTSGRFRGLEATPGPAASDFNTAFTDSFGQAPQNQMANTYDAACLAVLAMALAGAGADGAAVRDRLLQDTSQGEVHHSCASALTAIAAGATSVNYEGASGSVDFDAEGDVAVTYDIQTYQAPQIVKVGCIKQDGSDC
jgi:branched-chain amino acid transport system substrate-binding protein/neutral amino acid transport system substrate-binding protein